MTDTINGTASSIIAACSILLLLIKTCREIILESFCKQSHRRRISGKHPFLLALLSALSRYEYMLRSKARLSGYQMCKSDAPVSALSLDDYENLSAGRIDTGIIISGPGTSSNDPSVRLSRLMSA